MNNLQSPDKKTRLQQYIKETRSARLIVNTNSRRGRELFKRAKKALREAGLTLEHCYDIKDPGRLPEVVAHAKDAGCKLIIVGGGDGTLSSVVDLLAYQDVVLGVLPLGTGNGFARSLGVPISLQGAIDTIVNGKVADVDLATADGDYFANIISFGFNAQVVHKTPDGLKKYLGVLAYFLSGLKEFIHNQPFGCTLTCDDEVYKVHTRQVIIANGSFYGISRITADARLDDRRLIVCVLKTESKWDIVHFWLSLIRGRLPADRHVKMINARKVECTTDEEQPVDIDGELTLNTPISVKLTPRALLVMAPLEFIDS